MWSALFFICAYQAYSHITGNPYFFLPSYALPLISSAFYIFGVNYFLFNQRIKTKWISFLTTLSVTLLESIICFLFLINLVAQKSRFDLSLIFLLIVPVLILMIHSKISLKILMFKEHAFGNLIGLIWVTGIFYLWAETGDGYRWVHLNDESLLAVSVFLLIPSGLPHSYFLFKRLRQANLNSDEFKTAHS